MRSYTGTTSSSCPEPEGPGPGGRSPQAGSALAAGAVALAAGAAGRLWQMWGRAPLEWADTADFLATSRAGWASLGLWAGRRPTGPALLLKALGGDHTSYIVAQATIAVVCWAALAAAVATVVRDRWVRVAAVAAVVAFSLTSPVTMWDRSVLSESLAVSLLALVLAAGLRLALGETPRRVALLLGAVTLWALVRDTHAAVLLVGGAAVAAAVGGSWLLEQQGRWRVRWRGVPAPDRRLWGAVAAGAIALGLLVGSAASYGGRHLFPLGNVYEVRVLPYPDRVAWFVDRGMPQGEVFAGPDARPPHVLEDGVRVLYVPEDDPALAPWRAWLESDGREALARYMATHPGYTLFEPLRSPERTFNNAFGDRQFYAPLDMRRVPLVDRGLALPTTVVLLVGAGVLGWLIGRGRWTPAMAVGLAAAVLAVPHGLVAWHSDGMETARHLVVPAVQLHVGVLLMAIGIATGSRTAAAG